jgi:NAD(P)-dependent dehydrogenase (short-subunit alcohol dehydrogenase family)
MVKPVAIITGASRGIGAATAKLLAKQGYAVCIHYRSNRQQAEAVVQSIQQAGSEAVAIQADLTQEQQILHVFESVDKLLGSVTALVNNAGDNGGVSAVEDVTLEKLQYVYGLNTFATMLCCREAIKRMRPQQGGAIVNITSEAAKFGGNYLAHYASAKAAVNTFTVSCAREVAKDNIRVNAVSPGVIDTDMHANNPPERIATLKQSLPMGRMGRADEVAQTIAWLLSEHASYVSGTVVTVAGGR